MLSRCILKINKQNNVLLVNNYYYIKNTITTINNKNNKNYSSMSFLTSKTNTNDNNNSNNINKFFKEYTIKSSDYNLEEKKNMIESFLKDSQGNNNMISKEKIMDETTTSSSDILESFIKIRDDLEKYISTITITNNSNRLNESIYTFDTILGELIKDNLKSNNKLYCKPLDLNNMEPKIWRQIIENEAVHPYENINNPLEEIKQRTGKNRTCLVLFHPLLPTMPLMSLYIAFTNGIPNNMRTIENYNNNEENVDSAIFYSISSLHKGLGGVNLGQILITKAVQYISSSKPEIINFCTLSPLPRFRKYLSKNNNNLVEKIKDKESIEEMKQKLEPLALNYIFKEKIKSNKAFDPVCNFHLKNGASIYRLNWDADESEKRIDESFGIMINYLYEINKLESNSKNYIQKGIISTNQVFDNQYKNNKF